MKYKENTTMHYFYAHNDDEQTSLDFTFYQQGGVAHDDVTHKHFTLHQRSMTSYEYTRTDWRGVSCRLESLTAVFYSDIAYD